MEETIQLNIEGFDPAIAELLMNSFNSPEIQQSDVNIDSNDIISEEHIVSNKQSQERLNIFSKLLDIQKKGERSVLDFEKAIDFYLNQPINIETKTIIQDILDECS